MTKKKKQNKVTVFIVCNLALVVSNVKSITTIHSWTNGGISSNVCVILVPLNP